MTSHISSGILDTMEDLVLWQGKDSLNVILQSLGMFIQQGSEGHCWMRSLDFLQHMYFDFIRNLQIL